jgi:hypothetical protein
MATLDEVFSKQLFGSEKRLSLFATIAVTGDTELYATGLSDITKLSVSFLSRELNRLVDLKMLTEAPEDKSRSYKLYQRTGSVFWDFVRKLHEERST